MRDTKKEVQQAQAASDRAQQKVDVQKDRLATMDMRDPDRPDQEKVLDAMVQNAATARLNQALSEE